MSDDSGKLPTGIMGKIKKLITDLEGQENKLRDRSGPGTLELKISEDESLWYVAYKTTAQ